MQSTWEVKPEFGGYYATWLSPSVAFTRPPNVCLPVTRISRYMGFTVIQNYSCACGKLGDNKLEVKIARYVRIGLGEIRKGLVFEIRGFPRCGRTRSLERAPPNLTCLTTWHCRSSNVRLAGNHRGTRRNFILHRMEFTSGRMGHIILSFSFSRYF